MNDILFYDGKCPICAKEIKLLNKLKSSTLELIDIHDHRFDDFAETKSRTQLLSVLHLKSYEQGWMTGVDASVMAWGHTPIGWLFKPLTWPFIKPLADRVYSNWANKRACDLGYKTK